MLYFFQTHREVQGNSSPYLIMQQSAVSRVLEGRFYPKRHIYSIVLFYWVQRHMSLLIQKDNDQKISQCLTHSRMYSFLFFFFFNFLNNRQHPFSPIFYGWYCDYSCIELKIGSDLALRMIFMLIWKLFLTNKI